VLALHIGNKNYSSWSLRPWVLMRELGIEFVEHMHPFGRGEDFSRFSPSGKVPCLHDGELVVWDSLAIVETLAETHAGVWPPASFERSEKKEQRPENQPPDRLARAWARAAAAEMHSGFAALRQHCSMNCGVRVRLREHPPALAADLARLDALWCEGLARFGGPFLAGSSFTAVDAFYAPVVFRVQSYGLALSEPAMAYVAHMLARPSMQQWYADALAETWRDEPHERDLSEAGELLADLRAG
jgi:glutathione S-transferase